MSSVSKSAGAVPVHKSQAKAAQTRRGLLYALPDWLMIIVLFFVPIVLLVVMACSRWSLLGGNRGVNFPDNFVKVFENKLFWPSIWFTLEYTVIVTIFLLVLGLGMAMIRASCCRPRRAWRPRPCCSTPCIPRRWALSPRF